MQPPRERTPRINLRDTRVLRAIILNATAAVVTLLILRLAILIVSGSSQPAIPRFIETITYPLVWPLRQAPVLNSHLGGDVLVADVVVTLVALFAGLLATGIVTGWRESGTRWAYRSHPFS